MEGVFWGPGKTFLAFFMKQNWQNLILKYTLYCFCKWGGEHTDKHSVQSWHAEKTDAAFPYCCTTFSHHTVGEQLLVLK